MDRSCRDVLNTGGFAGGSAIVIGSPERSIDVCTGKSPSTRA